jgi:hypothetical protein
MSFDPVEQCRAQYNDAYRISATVETVGSTLKWIGVVGSILFVGYGALALSDGAGSPGLSTGYQIGLVVLAACLWLALFFIAGVVVTSLGQILRATLDTAVNTSTLRYSANPVAQADGVRGEHPVPSSSESLKLVYCSSCQNASRVAPDQSCCPKCGRRI